MNDAIHQTRRDEDIVVAALEFWASRSDPHPNVSRALELALQCRIEGGLQV